jgi:hypothetical protein
MGRAALLGVALAAPPATAPARIGGDRRAEVTCHDLQHPQVTRARPCLQHASPPPAHGGARAGTPVLPAAIAGRPRKPRPSPASGATLRSAGPQI